jgi:hypothetical protein
MDLRSAREKEEGDMKKDEVKITAINLGRFKILRKPKKKIRGFFLVRALSLC